MTALTAILLKYIPHETSLLKLNEFFSVTSIKSLEISLTVIIN